MLFHPPTALTEIEGLLNPAYFYRLSIGWMVPAPGEMLDPAPVQQNYLLRRRHVFDSKEQPFWEAILLNTGVRLPLKELDEPLRLAHWIGLSAETEIAGNVIIESPPLTGDEWFLISEQP